MYDGDGNRVKGTDGGVTTVYLGNYYEWNGSARVKYYYAGGQRIAMRDASSTLYFLLGDHLGSTAKTVTTSGALYGELRYHAYGGIGYASGTTPTSFHFTGQREDSYINLIQMGARWYDPYLSRFILADTIVPGAGNPQALNRYSYVLGNPLKYTDPSGHMPTDGCQTEGCAASEYDDRLPQWAKDDIIKAKVAAILAAWKTDAWLYEHVPSAVGVQFPIVAVSGGGYVGLTGQATRSYIFNWRSGSLDQMDTIEVGGYAGAPKGIGLAVKAGTFTVMGASTNDSWAGNYVAADFDADAIPVAPGVFAGGYHGVSESLVNDPAGAFRATGNLNAVSQRDPTSGMPIDTTSGGVEAGTFALTTSLTVGTSFNRTTIFDLTMPFRLIPGYATSNPFVGQ